MSKVIIEQCKNELVFIIEGEEITYSLPLSTEQEATVLKPEIREIIFAVERSWQPRSSNRNR